MKNKNSASKAIKLVLISIILQVSVYSQNVENIFSDSANQIIWLGVDFTQTRIIGNIGTVSTLELLPLFDKINLLIISERDKYNFEKALHKSKIAFDLHLVNKINSGIDAEKIVTYASSLYDSNRINVELIANLVKQYKTDKQDGIGLVFFMETLDKLSETGTMWVTFFNLTDYKVLLTERMKGDSGGIGFRNYWANTVYEVIKQIKLSKYKEWKTRYSI